MPRRMLYISIFRTEDGYCAMERAEDSDDAVTDMVDYMKQRVDATIDVLIFAACVLLAADLLQGPQCGAMALPLGLVAMTLATLLPEDQDSRRRTLTKGKP